ncbi:MAG: hypothetical protein COA47_09120 [Robiginitomaculum sp.]|nr:MAG: hypothetical protein COA47_09120 [Robiginitomaculum sp.]
MQQMRFWFVSLLAGLGFCGPVLAMDCPSASFYEGLDNIEITAEPMQPHKDGFGSLQFRSLLMLSSEKERFGGISAIDVFCDDQFVAVTDHGNLLFLDFDEDESGQMSLAPIVRMTPLHDANGTVIARKNGGRKSDAESIDWNGKNLLVGFEQHHRILCFDLSKHAANVRGHLVFKDPLGDGVRNDGMEALTRTTSSKIVVGLERNEDGFAPLAIGKTRHDLDFADHQLPLRGHTRTTGFDILPANDNHPQILFSVHRDWDHEVSKKNTIRIARTELLTGPDGAVTLGETVFLAEFHQAAQDKVSTNIEGIAARQLENGDVRLVLVTDNNFSRNGSQATLLLSLDVPADLLVAAPAE